MPDPIGSAEALKTQPGFFTPDARAEPRPPYQMRAVTGLLLCGRTPPDVTEHVLPRGISATSDGFFLISFYDVPDGWGPVPFRWFYTAFEVAGYDGPDGSVAAYHAIGAVSGQAGDILPRDYCSGFQKGDVVFSLTDTAVTGRAPLGGGAGEIRVSATRVDERPGTNAGVTNFLGSDGNGGLTLCAIGFSYTFCSLEAIRIEVDLPSGHPLEYLRRLTPDWGIALWDKSASISPPQALSQVYDDQSSRMAFLDTLGRIGRAVAIVEQNGRLAYLNAEAQAILRGESGAMLTRLPQPQGQAALIHPLSNPLREPALLSLPSGRQLAARAFPIALRMGQGPLSMVLLTDPRAPGQTDPEPLLRLMGLTPAESALATLIGNGLSPGEAARRRGITQSTARSMLKAVFSKLGIGRQAQLAQIVTRLQGA